MNTRRGPHDDQESNAREGLLQYQQRQFRKLVRHAWRQSAFYREFYSSHGINERALEDLAINDLPLLPKKTLIDNFDRAVTDPRLRRKELSEWFETHHDPNEAFCSDIVAIHGSGTSGDIGIFAYDRKAWTVADSTVATHLPMPENYPRGKTRIAFYVSAKGHFATVSMAVSLPKDIYDPLILSLLDPTEETIRQLNAFQPHRLTGYSSSVAQLAEIALEGKLTIAPQRIFVGGDKLTPGMERKIQAAWNAPIFVLYAASESKYIAIKTPDRDQMLVMDDLNIVEVLNERDQSVAAEQEGRVVLTNLYNYTLPMLRYELGDYVVRGTQFPDVPCTTLRDIRGRVNDALPVLLPTGEHDSIHPIVLTTFYVPTLEKLQFVSINPAHVRIDYVAPANIDISVKHEFQRMLDEKGVAATTLEVRHVPAISNDPVTGKLRLVRFEGRTPRPLPRVEKAVVPIAAARVHLKRSPSFESFSREDIEQSIPARFERVVERCARQPAIRQRDRTINYQELNNEANRLANAICARLSETQKFVALLLDPGISAAIAMLGILKAGKCYVPLEPGFPLARLSSIWNEVEPSLIITNDRGIPSARSFVPESAGILNLDELDRALPNDNPKLAATPDSLAYFFTTSGSTGKPKGVAQSHRSALHQIMSYTNGLLISSEDRMTQLFSHSFSASRLDIFGALLNGATLYPLMPGVEGLGSLARQLVEEKLTLLHWLPTGFRSFVDTLKKKEDFPDVRVIVLGSEPLTAHDVELYKEYFSSDCVLVNRFGSTETGNITWYFLNKDTSVPAGTVPVGYAIEDTEVLLLDQTGQVVGDNEIGEIAVKSPHLPSGYWRQPELTGDKFQPVPGLPGTSIYRTGDMGRRLLDGCLLHVGRKDLQLKIRGYRIDPGEVETALLEHPDIAEAAVAPGRDTLHQQDQCLVAYYVPTRSQLLPINVLREFLGNRLPPYMVPTVFMPLQSLPLTPNGKLDREALPRPSFSPTAAVAPAAAPQSDIHETLTKIWCGVLGLRSVGLDQSLFDLGGNSLHAMMIISRAFDAFGVEVAIPEFFEQPTITHLAQIIGGVSLTNDERDLAATLEMIESLSDEEARRLLKEETED